MTLLATNLVDLSYDGDRQFDYRPPTSPANCNVRYQAPASDQDNPMVASVADPRALLAAAARDRRGMNRLASARWERARPATPAAKDLRFANSFGMAAPDFTPLPRAE